MPHFDHKHLVPNTSRGEILKEGFTSGYRILKKTFGSKAGKTRASKKKTGKSW